MLTDSKRVVALYVDRVTQQWVARDSEGRFWSLPSTDNPWDERRPFARADETKLDPVPGHYKYMLGLPV
jgi:hypothetical protein